MGRAENTYGVAIRELLDIYNTQMETYQKDGLSLAAYLWKEKVSTQMAYNGKKKYQGFHCYVDTLVYVSNVASSITLATLKFRLSYVETMSLLRCFAVMPYTTHFFAVKVMQLLKCKHLRQWEILLGWYLMHQMLSAYEKQKGKIPGY